MILDLTTVLDKARQVPNVRALESLARVNPQANAAVSTVTSMAAEVSNLYAQVQLLKYGDDGSIEDTTDQVRSSYQKSLIPQTVRSVENALNMVKEVQASVPALLTESITAAGEYEVGDRQSQCAILIDNQYFTVDGVANLTANADDGNNWDLSLTLTPIEASQIVESRVWVISRVASPVNGTTLMLLTTEQAATGALLYVIAIVPGQQAKIALATRAGNEIVTTLTPYSRGWQLRGECLTDLGVQEKGVLEEISPPSEVHYLNIGEVINEYVDTLTELKTALSNL